MSIPKIKICRILDLKTARTLVEQGIDFLGFHVIEESDLDMLDEYEKIDLYLKKEYDFFGSVLLTKIANKDLLSQRIFKSTFSNIQLHYYLDEEIITLIHQKKIGKKFFFIYDPKINEINYLNQLKSLGDFIILDNIEGGLGKSIEIDNRIVIDNTSFFIAGGVNSHNIRSLNKKHGPYGFDIQSSCEIKRGIKNFKYIAEIQQKIK